MRPMQCKNLISLLLHCIGLIVMFFPLQKIQQFQFSNSPNWAKRGHEKKNSSFFKNSDISLPMSKLSFFSIFNDLPPKNRAQFDQFSPFFEFQPSLFMHFSDAEILIVRAAVFNKYHGHSHENNFERHERSFAQTQH